MQEITRGERHVRKERQREAGRERKRRTHRLGTFSSVLLKESVRLSISATQAPPAPLSFFTHPWSSFLSFSFFFSSSSCRLSRALISPFRPAPFLIVQEAGHVSVPPLMQSSIFSVTYPPRQSPSATPSWAEHTVSPYAWEWRLTAFRFLTFAVGLVARQRHAISFFFLFR